MKKFLLFNIILLISIVSVGKIYASVIKTNNINSEYNSLTYNKSYSTNSAIVDTTNSNLGNSNIVSVNNNIKIVKKPKGETYKTFMTKLLANSNVKNVSPDYVRHFSSLPNNTDINLQKDLFDIKAPVVDNSGFTSSLGGSSNIKVAVLDSGVEYQSYTNSLTGTTYAQAPALSNLNIVDPYNALAVYNNQTVNEYSPYDSMGHGTFVTSVINSSTNNDSSGSQNYGVAGIAFNTSIMPVKIGNSNGIPLGAELLGIQWAINNGANVINLSIGGSTPSSQEQNLIEQAISDGIAVVASSGNNGTSSLDYPAGYPGVIAVGASNSTNNLTAYSNYGCSTDNNCQTLVAPVGYNNPLVYQQSYTGFGSGTVSSFTSISNQYAAGTSFSAPQVTAAIALYDSKYGVQSLNVINKALEKSSTNIGSATDFGYGLLNINSMLNISPSEALSTTTFNQTAQAYNILSSNGTVFTEGNFNNYGGVNTINQNYGHVTDIVNTANNQGYYILTSSGSVYTFGNAQFFGSMYNIPNPPVKTAIAMVLTPDNKGYYILTADGGIYTFGDAKFSGSLYNIPSSAIPNRTPVALAITTNGGGYYIVTQNGSIYTFGNAQFFGSVYNIPNAPVKTTVDFQITSNNQGYYLLTADGAVYTFGNAQFSGSMYNIPKSSVPSNVPKSLLLTSNNSGYYILEQDGAVYTFGNAQYQGSIFGTSAQSITGN
jgi:serine protease